MLRPSERWFWTYCNKKDRLLLDISDKAQFCSPFAQSQLIQQPQKQPLSMAEAQAFWQIDESLQQLDLPAAVRLELCLTALCAPFVQQQAHKSWYFQQGQQYEPAQFDVVTMRGLSSQYALVLSTDTECANCLLLGEITTLAGKVLPRLQIIRVLANRISSLKTTVSYRQIA
ncbi:cell division protein ZapC domain-containing protein [Rheinheimera sp.]|uniref:cell division protein ZapC domain-containing protein n=1 Tax=Rheinheimera sp. TaxID=1869214 RepID=UPI0023557821|nr:cell division protein ZapC domain-containing protein [Rheinheimera sp.]